MHDVRSTRSLSSPILPAIVCGLSALFSGCSTLSYYGQAVAGHWRVMSARVPVQQVIDDPTTPEKTRASLQRAQLARQFASVHMTLPDNASYTSFVDLKRDAVTWNVIATQPLSVEPEQWCFPVAGCLSYRGYFHRDEAQAYADRLEAEGMDVAVTRASAYSSLGWFDDPLLNTMITRVEPLLAGVIFHELAHQQLYVKDDSSFNESFATFVERQGVRDWLLRKNSADLQQRYDGYQARQEDFLLMLSELRASLEAIYLSEKDVEYQLEAKAEAFAQLRHDYRHLKIKWAGYSGYDGWFEKPLNNARVAGVSTYNRWVGAFATLFADSGENYARFYQLSAELAALPSAQRLRRLEELSPVPLVE